MRHFALAFLAIAAVALVAAIPVGAKDGVQATLTTDFPTDAEPGSHVRVAWTLASVDEDGKRQPFGASGVYVRLLSASGGDAQTGFADSGRTGEYTTTVAVPQGGIADVEIGLVGWASGADGTRRGDAFFAITNDPLPGTRVRSPGFPACPPNICVDPATVDPGPEAASIPSGSGQGRSEDADTTTWILIAIGGCLLTLGVLALVVRHRHARGGARASDRGAPVAE
jgi:hypothetical protein